jgi:primosomal protein N'
MASQQPGKTVTEKELKAMDKQQLIELATLCGVDTSGTREQLRKALHPWVTPSPTKPIGKPDEKPLPTNPLGKTEESFGATANPEPASSMEWQFRFQLAQMEMQQMQMRFQAEKEQKELEMQMQKEQKERDLAIQKEQKERDLAMLKVKQDHEALKAKQDFEVKQEHEKLKAKQDFETMKAQQEHELKLAELQAASATPAQSAPAFRTESAAKLLPRLQNEADTETYILTFEKIAGLNNRPKDK